MLGMFQLNYLHAVYICLGLIVLNLCTIMYWHWANFLNIYFVSPIENSLEIMLMLFVSKRYFY